MCTAGTARSPGLPFINLLARLIFLFYFFALQLQMLGYDVSWAAFNIVEVMSSSKFTYKVS